MKMRVVVPAETMKTLEQTDYYCPACGKREVWAELEAGRAGPERQHSRYYGCAACKETWLMDPWIEAERMDSINMETVARLAAQNITN